MAQQSFFSYLQETDQILSKIPVENCVVVWGMKRSYKTSLVYNMIGKQLIGRQRAGRVVYQPTQIYNNAQINHNPNSESILLNRFEYNFKDNNYSILDLPGLVQNPTSTKKIVDYYTRYRIFSKTQNVRFILTVPQQYFTGVYKNFKVLIDQYIRIFKFSQSFKLENLVQSTLLVVTNAPLNLTIQDIIAKFNLVLKYNQAAADFFKFLTLICQKKNLEIFKMAQDDKPASSITVMASLSKIKEIQINPLQNMNYNFSQVQQSKLNDIYGALLIKCVRIITSEINSITQQIKESDPFKLKLAQYNSFIEKNELKYYENKIMPDISIDQQYFKNYSFIQVSYKLNEQLFPLNFKIPQEFWKIFVKYLHQIALYFIKTEQQIKIFNKLFNIFARKFEEANIFQLIKVKTFAMRDFKDQLTSCYFEPMQQVQARFIHDVEIKNKQTFGYYKDLCNILKKQSKNNQERKEKLCVVIMQSARYHLITKKNKIQSGKLFIEALKYSEQYNEKLVVKKYNQQLYQLSGKLFYSLGFYAQALKIFIVIDYSDKILECYEMLIKTENQREQKYKFLLQKANYYMQLFLFENGILTLKHAHDITLIQQNKILIKMQIQNLKKNRDKLAVANNEPNNNKFKSNINFQQLTYLLQRKEKELGKEKSLSQSQLLIV